MSFTSRAGVSVSVLVSAIACKSPPPPSEGTTPPVASSVAPVAPNVAPAVTDDCQKLKKNVIDAAVKLAACKTNDDCKVHRIPVCDFHELGCYAAHVNKAGDTGPLDNAVSEYSKTCSLTKCKCEMPQKSACKNGACTGE
jgi:hypothetical protein